MVLKLPARTTLTDGGYEGGAIADWNDKKRDKKRYNSESFSSCAAKKNKRKRTHE